MHNIATTYNTLIFSIHTNKVFKNSVSCFKPGESNPCQSLEQSKKREILLLRSLLETEERIGIVRGWKHLIWWAPPPTPYFAMSLVRLTWFLSWVTTTFNSSTFPIVSSHPLNVTNVNRSINHIMIHESRVWPPPISSRTLSKCDMSYNNYNPSPTRWGSKYIHI